MIPCVPVHHQMWYEVLVYKPYGMRIPSVSDGYRLTRQFFCSGKWSGGKLSCEWDNLEPCDGENENEESSILGKERFDCLRRNCGVLHFKPRRYA